MPKKTTRPKKSSLQRTREEQWRRRLSAQGITAAEGQAATYDPTELEDTLDIEMESEAPARAMTPAAGPATRTATRTRLSADRATTAVQQRRSPGASASAARASRLRPAVSSMSIDDEMYYVRSDIRRLIILTAICLAVLIALSFVIR